MGSWAGSEACPGPKGPVGLVSEAKGEGSRGRDMGV